MQPLVMALLRHAVAEARQFRPFLHACHCGAHFFHALEVIVGGEGQVALARAHVAHCERLAGPGQAALPVGGGEQIHEAFDLAKFIAHPFAHFAAGVGDFQFLQITRPHINPPRAVPVVFQGGGVAFDGNHPQAVLCAEFQLRVLGLRKEMRAHEFQAQPGSDQGERLGEKEVFCFIAGKKTADHATALLTPDGHGPQKQLAQGTLGRRGVPQRQFDKSILVKAGLESREKP